MIIKILLPVIMILNCFAVFAGNANSNSHGNSNSFFEQRYRGWIWFEDKEKQQQALKEEQKMKIQRKKLLERQKRKAEFAKARAEVEKFKQELEDLRYMMIRYPENLKHVLAYKKKEAEMLEGALKLDHSYRMVNFLYPDHINLIANSNNLYGRRINEELRQDKTTNTVKKLAAEIELFFFFSGSCPHSKQLEPVLAGFAGQYGFKVSAITMDGEMSKYFPTFRDGNITYSKDGEGNQKQIPQIAKELGIKQTPVVIAVTNDSKIRFELWRGSGAITELEEACILAFEYLNRLRSEEQKQDKNRNNKRKDNKSLKYRKFGNSKSRYEQEARYAES